MRCQRVEALRQRGRPRSEVAVVRRGYTEQRADDPTGNGYARSAITSILPSGRIEDRSASTVRWMAPQSLTALGVKAWLTSARSRV
jgi:hypothetical protein